MTEKLNIVKIKRKYSPKHYGRYQPKHMQLNHPRTVAGVVLGLAFSIVAVSVGVLAYMAHSYVLLDGGQPETVYMFPGSVAEACVRFGVDESAITAEQGDDRTIYLTVADSFDVSIRSGKGNITVRTTENTVRNILQENGIEVGEDDLVKPGLDTNLRRSTEITITRVTYDTLVETETVPFEVEEQFSDQLAEGEQQITQQGVYGERTIEYRLTLHDGEEYERTLLSDAVTTEPVNCIVVHGTKKEQAASGQAELNVLAEESQPAVQTPAVIQSSSGNQSSSSQSGLSTAGRGDVWSVPAGITDDTANKTITAADGSTYRYSSVIDVTATAYHRIEDGGTITATGTTTRYGTIAVDPSVIPLGSRLYVVSSSGQSWSYGPGLAEDTGGLIKGAKIDLFFMTEDEAVEFGVRQAKVYILSD